MDLSYQRPLRQTSRSIVGGYRSGQTIRRALSGDVLARVDALSIEDILRSCSGRMNRSTVAHAMPRSKQQMNGPTRKIVDQILVCVTPAAEVMPVSELPQAESYAKGDRPGPEERLQHS